MDEMKSITYEEIELAQDAFMSDRANNIAKNAVSAQGIRKVAHVPEAAPRYQRTFDIEVKTGERCDQKRSGRCWMFAALNTMRMRTIAKYNLKTFELSQAYPMFWDKLEKANWFLENIIDTRNEPLGSRLVAFLLTDPVGDGGQWDMFRALVSKYGVVPHEAMPDTACCENTSEMNAYLTRYLRSCAKQLRDHAASGDEEASLRVQKKAMMENVHHFLITCLGCPPKSFDVRLRDKDDNLVLTGTFTPQSFFNEAVGMKLDDFISVISAPTSDKPFGHVYTVARLGNIVEAGGVRYLNVPVGEMKRYAAQQLKDGLPVWFGCDVDQDFMADKGVMDQGGLAIDELFGFPIVNGFDKAARLDYGESVMTHAMTLVGLNVDENDNPTLWKVENSWGKDHGREGFDALSDEWFGEYVYQIVVDKKYLSEEERKIYDTEEPIVLEPWDPLGALA